MIDRNRVAFPLRLQVAVPMPFSSGRLEIRQYKDSATKEDRQITEIICNELVFLGGGRGEPRLGEPGSSVQGDDPPLDELPPF
jgi:hypothetical protein